MPHNIYSHEIYTMARYENHVSFCGICHTATASYETNYTDESH